MAFLRTLAPTPIEESLPRLKRLVSPYTGIVNRLYEIMGSPGDPKTFHFASVATDGRGLIGSTNPTFGGGIHPVRDRAFAAAIGEAVERYSAAYMDERRVRLSTAQDLVDTHVEPAAVELFSDRQYVEEPEFVPFTDTTPVRWVQGFSLPTGEPVLLPAALCFLHDSVVQGEARIAYSTSSGLACGPTFEEALLNALYELVERDAFLVTWSARLSMPRLDWSHEIDLGKEEARYFARTGIQYRALDLSPILNIPTVMVVMRDPSEFVPLSVSSASARTIQDAWRKAMREGFQTHAFARSLHLERPDWVCTDFLKDITTFEDHVRLYTSQKYAQLASFMDCAEETRPIAAVAPLSASGIREQIEAIAARLHDRDVDVYAIDLTSPDIVDAGLRVVRAFSPQLTRLDVSYRHRFLGVQRLYDGARRAGLTNTTLSYDELNPLPHPFP